MHKILVSTDRGEIEILFKVFKKLYQVVSYQVGIFTEDQDEFCEKLSEKISIQWNEKFKLGVFNLPDNSIILDIGGGVGLLDIVLLKYLNNNSVIHILDKTAITKKNKHWGADHGFYNNRQVTLDLIESNNIPSASLNFINISDDWPSKLDLIMSNNSYLWHYPKEIYWDKIKPYAVNNCKLAFDIFNRENTDYVQEIEQDINRPATVSYKPAPSHHWYKDEIYEINGTYGRCCAWL
jgi:hypothetical protein